MPMTRRSVLAATALTGLLLVPARGFAWQDLSPDYVRAQVERIADPKTPAADRRAATWALASAGRASVGGIAALARTEPRLLWTAIGLLDLVRTDALVVELFSQFLDKRHRALSVRDEGKGRWLVRTGDAYFFFAGTPLRCVKAGMKPIE